MAVYTESLTQLEAEVIDIFVRGVQLLGLPKSIGEIYGLLYITPAPLSMNQIMAKLNISLGSASQGLKQLRSFRAVKAIYRAGDRKDYYTAEAEFRKLTVGFFREEVFPQLESAAERLQSIQSQLDDTPTEDQEYYKSRLIKLNSWLKHGHGLVGKIIKFIKF